MSCGGFRDFIGIPVKKIIFPINAFEIIIRICHIIVYFFLDIFTIHFNSKNIYNVKKCSFAQLSPLIHNHFGLITVNLSWKEHELGRNRNPFGMFF